MHTLHSAIRVGMPARAVLALTMFSGQALAADRVFIEEWADPSRTHSILRPATAADLGEVSPTAVSTNFDNWTGPSDGGPSLFFRAVRTGGDEVDDDLALTGNSGGALSGSGDTVFNLSTTGNLISWQRTLRWYDENGVLLAQHTVRLNTSANPIPAGSGVRIRQRDGFWDFLNLILPDRISVSVQFADPVGIDLVDMGQSIYKPIWIGSSSHSFRNFTTGQNIANGTDQASLSWYMRTTVIPSPSFAAIVCGGLLLHAGLRRRK